jgi:hypothetical protein
MSGFRRIAIAAVAAATITVGSLVAPPPASAATMTCSTAGMVSEIYELTGTALAALGQKKLAFYWFGRAAGVLDGACG